MKSLEGGGFYHIYNCGINGENLFCSDENYKYFLKLYREYIVGEVETFAWCLMKNHFHLLVRIKDLTGFQNLSGLKPHHAFSNLFNAYAKAFNRQNNRHGALFERPFKRKRIDDETYLKQVVVYIHNNPVHHKFCDETSQYEWSSYKSCLSSSSTNLQRDEVLNWFETRDNFIGAHTQRGKTMLIERELELTN